MDFLGRVVISDLNRLVPYGFDLQLTWPGWTMGRQPQFSVAGPVHSQAYPGT